MRFEFSTATRVIFGSGTLLEVASLAANFGKRAFVVTGRNIKRSTILLEQITSQGIEITTFRITGEPTTASVLKGVQRANEAVSDFVIGIGGGSVIDAGKAIAAILTNGGEPLDYLEVIGQGKSITNLPCKNPISIHPVEITSA